MPALASSCFGLATENLFPFELLESNLEDNPDG